MTLMSPAFHVTFTMVALLRTLVVVAMTFQATITTTCVTKLMTLMSPAFHVTFTMVAPLLTLLVAGMTFQATITTTAPLMTIPSFAFHITITMNEALRAMLFGFILRGSYTTRTSRFRCHPVLSNWKNTWRKQTNKDTHSDLANTIERKNEYIKHRGIIFRLGVIFRDSYTTRTSTCRCYPVLFNWKIKWRKQTNSDLENTIERTNEYMNGWLTDVMMAKWLNF